MCDLGSPRSGFTEYILWKSRQATCFAVTADRSVSSSRDGRFHVAHVAEAAGWAAATAALEKATGQAADLVVASAANAVQPLFPSSFLLTLFLSLTHCLGQALSLISHSLFLHLFGSLPSLFLSLSLPFLLSLSCLSCITLTFTLPISLHVVTQRFTLSQSSLPFLGADKRRT